MAQQHATFNEIIAHYFPGTQLQHARQVNCPPRNKSGAPASHAVSLQGFFGTFAPFFRASESPMAIACLRNLTVPPLPPLPDFKVPRSSRCMALFTLFAAALPYFLVPDFLPDRLVLAMGTLLWLRVQNDQNRVHFVEYRALFLQLFEQRISVVLFLGEGNFYSDETMRAIASSKEACPSR